MKDPRKASKAASPPDEPPGDNNRLYGFVYISTKKAVGSTVLPQRLLKVSAIIIAVGTFVLQYRIAPSSRRIVTNSDSVEWGELAHFMNPSVESCPLTLNRSLIETGRPCNYSQL